MQNQCCSFVSVDGGSDWRLNEIIYYCYCYALDRDCNSKVIVNISIGKVANGVKKHYLQ